MHLSESNSPIKQAEKGLQKIHLVFPDLRTLWTFAESLTDRNMQINTEKKTLTCFCDQDDISLATSGFNAIIVEKPENLD